MQRGRLPPRPAADDPDEDRLDEPPRQSGGERQEAGVGPEQLDRPEAEPAHHAKRLAELAPLEPNRSRVAVDRDRVQVGDRAGRVAHQVDQQLRPAHARPASAIDARAQAAGAERRHQAGDDGRPRRRGRQPGRSRPGDRRRTEPVGGCARPRRSASRDAGRPRAGLHGAGRPRRPRSRPPAPARRASCAAVSIAPARSGILTAIRITSGGPRRPPASRPPPARRALPGAPAGPPTTAVAVACRGRPAPEEHWTVLAAAWPGSSRRNEPTAPAPMTRITTRAARTAPGAAVASAAA